MPKDDRRGSLVPAAAAAGVGLAGVGAAAHQVQAGKKAGGEYSRIATHRANFDADEHQKLMATHDKNKAVFTDSHKDSAGLRRARAQGDDLQSRLSRGTAAREKAATRMSAGPTMASEMINSRLKRVQHEMNHAPDRPAHGTPRRQRLYEQEQDLYAKRGNLRRAWQHAGDNKKSRPQVHQSNLSTARILDDIQGARKHRATNEFVAATDARLARVIDTRAMQAASEKARKPLVAAEEAAERKVMQHARGATKAGLLGLAGVGTAGALVARAYKKKKSDVEKQYLKARVAKALSQIA